MHFPSRLNFYTFHHRTTAFGICGWGKKEKPIKEKLKKNKNKNSSEQNGKKLYKPEKNILYISEYR
jgi:hypothetical protein